MVQPAFDNCTEKSMGRSLSSCYAVGSTSLVEETGFCGRKSNFLDIDGRARTVLTVECVPFVEQSHDTNSFADSTPADPQHPGSPSHPLFPRLPSSDIVFDTPLDLSGVTKRCLAATGRPSIFLPRFVAVDNPEEDASLPARANIADKLSSVEASADASETGPLPGAIARRSRESDSDVPSESIGDEDRSEEEEGAVCQRDDGPAGTTKPKIIPLDLALYSLKSWYEGKASTASALEKREGARKFLVHLAGRDPGDAHEALRLSGSASSNHDPQASSVRVVVSDDFLDEVRQTRKRRNGIEGRKSLDPSQVVRTVLSFR